MLERGLIFQHQTCFHLRGNRYKSYHAQSGKYFQEQLQIWSASVHRSCRVKDHQLIHLEFVEDADRIARISDVGELAETDGLHEA